MARPSSWRKGRCARRKEGRRGVRGGNCEMPHAVRAEIDNVQRPALEYRLMWVRAVLPLGIGTVPREMDKMGVALKGTISAKHLQG